MQRSGRETSDIGEGFLLREADDLQFPFKDISLDTFEGQPEWDRLSRAVASM
jgi:hypothetical protein